MSNGDNIQVAVRLRPLLSKEIASHVKVKWKVEKNTVYQIDDNGQRYGEPYCFGMY